ncbi:MAG: gamma carbonic anhydrase family protein [Gemmatimonadota bacterium]
MAIIIPFRGKTPRIADDAFVAPTAVLIGDVTVGSESSIWFGAVIRGDDPDHGIRVGRRTSVQENCVIHVGHWGPTIVGDDCTVGHGAMFECCTIGDGTTVGMNSVILQNAVIGSRCVIAAGAVVLARSEIPDRSVVAGVPAKVRKTLKGDAVQWVKGGGTHYVELSREYLADGIGNPDPSGPSCELCGGPTTEVHCKIICLRCGFKRDCSDP